MDGGGRSRREHAIEGNAWSNCREYMDVLLIRPLKG
jgi:hypothetical protein